MILIKVPTRQDSSMYLEKKWDMNQRGEMYTIKIVQNFTKLEKIVTVLHCGKIHEPKCKWDGSKRIFISLGLGSMGINIHFNTCWFIEPVRAPWRLSCHSFSVTGFLLHVRDLQQNPVSLSIFPLHHLIIFSGVRVHCIYMFFF